MFIGKLTEAEKDIIEICEVRNECTMGCNGCKFEEVCEDFCKIYRVGKPMELYKYIK